MSRAFAVALLALCACGRSDGGGWEGPSTKPDRARFRFAKVDLPEAARATDFAFLPGTTDEILVSGQDGALRRYQLDGPSARLADRGTPSALSDESGCGLLSFAFDPGFESNRFLYVATCVDHTTNRLLRYELTSLDSMAESGVEIYATTNPDRPKELWHRWGSMGFEPDGETLWITLGDNELSFNGQDTRTLPGSLLRIRPNREPGGSGSTPATGNAFATEAEGHPAIYAFGFRSPWRASRDRFGRFFVGDVGNRKAEEVNVVARAGQNFGWATFEGPCDEGCDGLTDPVRHWGRSSDEPYVRDDPDTEPATKRTVWVGQPYEPEGASWPDRYFGYMDDVVPFGDYFTGWVRGMRVGEDGAVTSDELYGHLTRITAWKTGPDGYMYALTLGGDLYRVLLAAN